ASGSAVHRSAPCQPHEALSDTISGAATAVPILLALVASPVTEPQRALGNQLSNTPVCTGKTGDCDTPRIAWASAIAMITAVPVSAYGASGVATVARQPSTPTSTNMRRAPQR